MFSIDDIFVTPIAINHPDFDNEWDRMIIRAEATQNFQEGLVNGTLSLGQIEEFADMLCEHEIEPYDYLDQVHSNIQYVIQQSRLS